MTLKLHLGVMDIPYSHTPPTSPAPQTVVPGTETTGDVAGWLENKYGIMEAFYGRYEKQIAALLADAYAEAAESLLMGGPARVNPTGAAMSSLEDLFKQFLSTSEIEGMGIDGVPTLAALMGVNHRLKRRRGPRRPSFIDTGQYQAAFRAWTE